MAKKGKTHSGAKKRFKPRANGFKHASANKRHILTKKSTKRKRQLRLAAEVPAGKLKAVTLMCGGK